MFFPWTGLPHLFRTPQNSSESCDFWKIFLKYIQIYFYLIKINFDLSIVCANLLAVLLEFIEIY